MIKLSDSVDNLRDYRDDLIDLFLENNRGVGFLGYWDFEHHGDFWLLIGDSHKLKLFV